MSEFFSEMWGSIVFCGIFWIIVMWVITNYKSSGTPQLDEEIRMEKEKKKDDCC